MTDMPETIWAINTDLNNKIWASHKDVTGFPVKTLINETSGVQYLLKSTVDVERAADSKTIRELATALVKARSQFLYYERLHTQNDKGDKALTNRKYADVCEQALSDNAPRIAEAQEGDGAG